MERVGILIAKLQEQLQQSSNIDAMLVSTQMLYTELLQEKEKLNGSNTSIVSITGTNNPPLNYYKEESPKQEQVIEKPQPVKEQELQPMFAEPTKEEVLQGYKNENVATTFVYDTPLEQPQPVKWSFDPSDVPTLTQQEKVVYELKDTLVENESSLNDQLKDEKAELGSALKETPIRDLKKGININERHRFIQTLFRGDETMYERSIKTINNFSIFAEAEFWIQRELKLKMAWDGNNADVKLFDQLVKRRFS